MILFSGISNAEIFTVLITVGLMPFLLLASLALGLTYFSENGSKKGTGLLVVTIFLFIDALILGIHQLINNEPGLIFWVCTAVIVYSTLILYFLNKSKKG